MRRRRAGRGSMRGTGRSQVLAEKRPRRSSRWGARSRCGGGECRLCGGPEGDPHRPNNHTKSGERAKAGRIRPNLDSSLQHRHEGHTHDFARPYPARIADSAAHADLGSARAGGRGARAAHTVLGMLIDSVGLEDAGELVALASSEQLQGLFDQDLWRAPARVRRSCSGPRRFRALARDHVRRRRRLPDRTVLCVATRSGHACGAPPRAGGGHGWAVAELHRTERKSSNASNGRWKRRFSKSGKSFACWRAIRCIGTRLWAALLALDRDHHDVLREILEKCCALSSEYIGEQGGLYEVLTSEEMLESDVAGEREDRRTAQGFIAPADARSFLEPRGAANSSRHATPSQRPTLVRGRARSRRSRPRARRPRAARRRPGPRRT